MENICFEEKYPNVKDRDYFPEDDLSVWHPAPCSVCGRFTRFYDGSMFWCGLPTPLCSTKCHAEYWGKISAACNTPDE